MKGISFKIENKYDTILDKILKNIDCDSYNWYITEDEIYKEKGNILLTGQLYTNREFKTIIKNEKHYVVFANIQLYFNSSKIKKIATYEDFINSDCQLILLVTDNIFVDIYVKEKKILKQIYQNALKNEFDDIKYITNDNDIRKVFSAYSD